MLKEIKLSDTKGIDLANFKGLTDEHLKALSDIAATKQGQVLMSLLDTYHYNRMVDVFTRKDSKDPVHRVVQETFDQGRSAGVREILIALRDSSVELEKRGG